MTVRDIVRWPDPRLSTICAPVPQVDAQVRALAGDMLDTMYAAPGRGLAAPQVGVMLRLFVMDVEWKDGPSAPRVFINPEIEGVGDEQATQREGCLSIPGLSFEVSRPTEVRLSWTDVDGLRQSEAFTGFAATCVQHELDHLDGIVTFDHLSPEMRAKFETEYAELAQ